MRLLQRLESGQVTLTDFPNDQVPPPYAILSHTWETDEVLFEHIKDGTAEAKHGYIKISFCADIAQRDGLQYFWVDTCCIDKASSAEVQESINHVSTTKRRKLSGQSSAYAWESDFRNSKWFTRGWTLQELLAPASVEFFSREATRLGDKKSLEQHIHEATRIPINALRGHPMLSYSKSQRLAWVEKRNTTREEDKAYCLFGIFDVQVPLLYGEGEERAFRRLFEEIDKGSNDEQDILSRCMKDLRSTDPRSDKSRIQQTKGGLLHDSYIWITEKHEYVKWHSNEENQLLWIKGDPGKGKTMLVCGIIDQLSPSTRLKDQAASTLLSFFFCQATDARINNATSVLRGLIYMLVDQQPSFISHMRKKYDLAGKQLFEDRNAWVALSEIFSSILNDPDLEMAYIIIDALDECITGLTLLLDLIIEKSATHQRSKWIVSSRNWPMIQERLAIAVHNVPLSLQLSKDAISAAVGAYIHHKIDDLAKLKRYDSKTRKTVTDYLLSNARDTFLWVALVCYELGRPEVRRYNTLSTLRKFPPELSKLYKQMLDQICSMENSEVFKSILAVTSAVYRPITLQELVSLLDMVEDLSEDFEYLSELIELCGSFLTIRQSTVFFVHQSAKDFLLEEAYHEISPAGNQDVHRDIFNRSMRIISRTLRRDMYDLSAPGFPIEQVKELEPDPLAEVQYSCIYWVDHLGELGSPTTGHGDDQVIGLVEKFLQHDYLHWLEALSLLRSMSSGVASMLKLKDLPQVTGNPLLSEQVQDACRFIQYHKWTIENSPLQAYSSSLLFSPTRSFIRKYYTKEEPPWILRKPVIESDWSACFSTLEGHRNAVNSVSWSPDTALVASASDDKSVKIWDPVISQCTLTLEGHTQPVKSIAWSPNAMYIASASEDKTIKIWNPEIGQCISTFQGHTDSVKLLSWSPTGSRLASASNDTTVRIWDPATSQCISILEGHCKPVNSIAWSPDMTQVVSASEDKTIKIWDFTLGQCLMTLEGHTESVNSVSWSPKTMQIASASSDKTVKIWDVESCQCVLTLEGHTDCARSIAWFSDAMQLVSAADDNTMKIWISTTGKCTSTLKGHSHSVLSIAVSHNEMWLASASFDTTIKIWDLAIEQNVLELDDHNNWVNSLAWSDDGAHLASASDDSTLKIWNLTTGRCMSTLRGHTNWVNTLVWSSDATRLASGSDDNTIKIWDPATSQCLFTLTDHENWIQSVAWSSDITRLASSSQDTTIKIWNPLTGDCISTIRGHSNAVISVAWSDTSMLLASASDDKTVKIWDPATGQCISTFNDYSAIARVAWFSGQSLIASVSRTGTFKLWDVATGQLLNTLEGYNCSLAWSFDVTRLMPGSDGQSSATASSSLSHLGHEGLESQLIGLNGDGTWITYRGENLLSLPSEHRPSSAAVHGRNLALGCATGRVLILIFSGDNPIL
ncbi:hypothetical protein S7711_07144 [Stachybotrys chartarum IBT 7711]|uniref:Mitochondrial division protein 1 n=1 Tax=Stachybotrys chartarum (strain CBS 109288 / IBT 7711) TaxID=1280523 RepID=A0A084BCF1_STACB|nr:hypothetical protein S7711_07144 [Stachybotrys chartarum IBT 7711]